MCLPGASRPYLPDLCVYSKWLSTLQTPHKWWVSATGCHSLVILECYCVWGHFGTQVSVLRGANKKGLWQHITTFVLWAKDFLKLPEGFNYKGVIVSLARSLGLYWKKPRGTRSEVNPICVTRSQAIVQKAVKTQRQNKHPWGQMPRRRHRRGIQWSGSEEQHKHHRFTGEPQLGTKPCSWEN